MHVAETCAFRGDDQVAAERELQPAGDGRAIQRRENRKLEFFQPERQFRHRSHESEISAGLVADGLVVFKVGARAERATASRHHDGTQVLDR